MIKKKTIAIGLLAMVCFGCSDNDDNWVEVLQWEDISTHLTFALPQRIVGDGTIKTRMQGDVVQQGNDAAAFRGLDNVRLLCFDDTPTAISSKRGPVIALPAMTVSSLHEPARTNYSLYPEIVMPTGTTYITAYAKAIDAHADIASESHEARRHYGCLQSEGLDRISEGTNADIRFRPVQICTSEEAFGGSVTGAAILDLLNDLISTIGPETAPNNRWATTPHPVLRQTYEALKALRNASSFNVTVLLTDIYYALRSIDPTVEGGQLAARLTQKIVDACTTTNTYDGSRLTLKSIYQNYPSSLHLPEGAARVVWDSNTGLFKEPDQQEYGKGLDIAAMTDYVYPANLQYYCQSTVAASDSIESPHFYKYNTWDQLIDSIYDSKADTIKKTTRSVALVNQLQYGVGRLDARVRLDNTMLYDAKGQAVDVTQGFTLKGILIGGQHEVDYRFRPVMGTHEYVIYDTDLTGTTPKVKHNGWTPYNYTLGLETAADVDVLLALELQNDSPDFEGADGRIVHGATFYLVANLQPSTGSNYSSATGMNRIFRQDYVTFADITIRQGWADTNGDGKPDPELDEYQQLKPLEGLATATYGLPTIDKLAVTMGLSVNLSWQEGITFEDVEF